MPERSDRNGLEIAIIDMSGRFPGAGNLHESWENLKNGINSIYFFNEEELRQNSNINPAELKQPNYIKAKGIIHNVEYFDASFFGYSPGEAELLDPQVRIFYEICWEALEDAGCDPSTYTGSIGLYAGGSANFPWELLTAAAGATDLTNKNYLSTRISYRLDLKGPAVSIDTACSTVLVGTELACRGLLTGQCDVALVGGICVMAESARGGGYLYREGFVRSPDGSVRTFDAQARGVVFSHGGGAVLLKRLDDAINISEVMEIQGKPNRQHLEQGFQRLLQRHKILRTTFKVIGHEPVQIIHKQVDFHIDYLEAQEKDIDKVIEQCIKPFNLTEVPLVRLTLITFGF